MDHATHVARARRLLAPLAIAVLAVHAAHGLLGSQLGLPARAYTDWLYDAVVIGAGLTTLARGLLVARERVMWLVLGAGMLCWAAGDLYWAAMPDVATPSPADVLYLLFYPSAYAAIVMLGRTRGTPASRGLWIDGVVAALAAAAIASALVFQPVFEAATGGATEIAANLAYPLGDVLLVAMLVALLAVGGWRVDRRWALLVGALAVNGVADGIYLYQDVHGTYVEGGILDTTWMTVTALLAVAAWQQPRAAAPSAQPEGVRMLVVPAVAAAAAVGLLAYGNARPVGDLPVALAVLALVGVVVRTTLTVRAHQDLLRVSRHEALTDPLTGLGNRRALLRTLEVLLAAGRADAGTVLVLFDLNGFKHYNDTYGHPAGDALLHRVGQALERSVGHGRAFRVGGDEFCALIPADGRPPSQLAATAAAALLEEGEGFTIGACFGEALLPTEATTSSDALRLADHRLYANKASGRASAGTQVRDALLSVLRERMPGLDDHNDRVLHLAERVARSLGITGADLDDLLHAAALHDVGKAAIPERILEKPGPLTSDERAFVQRHTIIGDRILAAAPALRRVGRIVRGSHERWDGAGYPDRLAGEEIPLASRIIAVCDAYDAMTEDRPYRSAMPDHEAAAELRRCAGTQFDPGVVDLFLDVVGAGDPRRLSTDIKSAGSVAEPPAMGAGPHEVIGT